MQQSNQISQDQLTKLLTALTIMKGKGNFTQDDILFYSNIIIRTNIGGCSFIRINDYTSNESNNTELASYTVNIGASYENQKDSDTTTYLNMKLTDIVSAVTDMLEKQDYKNIDFINQGYPTLDHYKQAVINSVAQAHNELLKPAKTTERVDNDIVFNKALRFNTNTGNWNIYGTKISKDVAVQGTFKTTKKAPKTLAKELIKKVGNAKTDKLRLFSINNILDSIRVQGETIDTYFMANA